MKASYFYRGKWYKFIWFESENSNQIIIVKDPGTDAETLFYIPCIEKAGTALQINKKTLSAEGAAYGVMKFIEWSTRCDIATCYINHIIDQFAA